MDFLTSVIINLKLLRGLAVRLDRSYSNIATNDTMSVGNLDCCVEWFTGRIRNA